MLCPHLLLLTHTRPVYTDAYTDTDGLTMTPPWRVRYNQRDWWQTRAVKQLGVQPIGTGLAGQASSSQHVCQTGTLYKARSV